MSYNAWVEGYVRAIQSPANRYNPHISIKEKRIGDWIVAAKVIGHGLQTVICIYNANTQIEHYRTNTIGPDCSEDAPEDVKDFYKRAFERNFERVVNMAELWIIQIQEEINEQNTKKENRRNYSSGRSVAA